MKKIILLLLTILFLIPSQTYSQRNLEQRNKTFDSGRISRIETERRKNLPPRNSDNEGQRRKETHIAGTLIILNPKMPDNCTVNPSITPKKIYNEFILSYYDLAIKEFQMGNYYQASIYFTDWLVNNPEDIDALYHRGICYYQMEWYRYAIEDFKIVLLLDNQFAAAYYYRGLCRFYRDERELAKIDFEIAYELGYDIAGIFLKKYF